MSQLSLESLDKMIQQMQALVKKQAEVFALKPTKVMLFRHTELAEVAKRLVEKK